MNRPQAAGLLLVVALVAGACGDSTGGPIFGSTGDTSTTTLGSTTTAAESTTTSTAAATTTEATTTEATTTTEAVPEDPVFDYLDAAPVVPPSDPPPASLGPSDAKAAFDIRNDIDAAGASIPGVLFAVYDVLGSEDRLLVLTLDDAVVEAAGDSALDPFLIALVGSPALSDAGITRLVFNYHGTDEGGDYVLTATVSMDEVLRAADAGTSIEGMVYQITRDGEVVLP
jgi:hypothetical protein